MMRLAGAVIKAAEAAGLAEFAEPSKYLDARYDLHYDNFGQSREDEDYQRQYALGDKLPPNPNEDEGGSVVVALLSQAIEDMRLRTGLTESQSA